MAQRGRVIVLGPGSDVVSLTVASVINGQVALGVNDADSDDSADGRPLIVGNMNRVQAATVARAILEAAGCTVADFGDDGAWLVSCEN
jgi:hypothetical protein